MKKVKYRFFLDYEKEEQWVNDMEKSGWHLEKFGFGRFVFKKGEPNTFVYRNEFIGGLSKKEKEEYFELLNDSGITVVHQCFTWIYMKRAVAEGPLELYTDTNSKIAYYNRILYIFLALFLANLCAGVSNIYLNIQFDLGIFRSSIGFFNIFVAALMAIPIIKITQNKRKLQEKQHFFE